jgi:hypothetical protein
MGNRFVLSRAGACSFVVLLGLPLMAFGDQTPDGTVVEAGQSDALEATLKRHGWRVEHDSEGALLLFPPSSEPAAEAADPLPAETGERIDATDLDALQAAAAEHGWTHRREADGSLVLLPPGVSPEPGDAGSCQIGMVRVSSAEEVPLPVDTEAKAYRLAESWLRESDVGSLAIGRIRQVNRLFIVSMVEDEEPFLLHTQLVVRVDDGCLMAIPR